MPKNLLVADDSITIQKVVGITFAGEDFRITAVDNGDDALARARELKPDLIIADVVMPRKNGYDVCEAVKADPALRHIPVLLLAGTFEAFDETRARAVHADAHIAKPFESQALLDKVKELLARPAQPAVPARVVAPTVKPSAPPPPAVAAPARPSPARPPPGAPPPVRPPGSAPPVGRPLAQPPRAAPLGAARPPGAAPVARPPAGPPSGLPPQARPLPPGPRAPAALPFSPPTFARPPTGPPPAAARPTPAMSAPPPPAPRLAAPVARDPFGLGEAPAAAAAPLAAAVQRPDHLDLDWGELEAGGPAPRPVRAALPPPAAEAAPVANARVVAIEELDFEPVLDAREPAAPAMELDFEPLAPDAAEVPPASEPAGAPPAATAAAPAVDGGEAQLRQALSQASREVIERIAWEVVPQLAETIIREQLERLVKERQR